MSSTSRRKPKDEGEHVHLVFPKSLLDKVDDHAAKLAAAQPGTRVTRSDVIRMATYKFVDG